VTAFEKKNQKPKEEERKDVQYSIQIYLRKN